MSRVARFEDLPRGGGGEVGGREGRRRGGSRKVEGPGWTGGAVGGGALWADGMYKNLLNECSKIQ